MVTFYLSFTVILIKVLMCGATSNYDSACDNGKKCVSKCCPRDSYYVYDEQTCASNTTLRKDFTDFNVYDNNLIRTKTLNDTFDIVYGEFMNFSYESNGYDYRFYLLEDGNLYMKIIMPNGFPETHTVKNDHFCIDYIRVNGSDGTFTPVYGYKLEEDEEKDLHFQIAGLIISDIFLLLVLIVYSLLKELRNLKGKILMAMVFSLFGSFTVLATSNIITSIKTYEPSENECLGYRDVCQLVPFSMVFSLFGSFTVLATSNIITSIKTYEPSENECLGYPSAFYFFILSTFFWMNVMSFDIWWTLRRMTNRVTIRGNRNNRKFLIYCVYAWGLPIAMTIGLLLMENADLTHMPWIIKPNIIRYGCFIRDKEKLLYLYTPMLILILCNSMFFLMTACNIWRSGNDAKILNTDSTRKRNIQKQRFLIYLKLSLVMGLSYVLEIISSFYPDYSYLWYITDAYNMLIGVAIFFIFVCKKKIFIKLSKRFQRKETNDNTESHAMSYSLSTSRN